MALYLCTCEVPNQANLLLSDQPALFVQERLLDDDGQMWMSFKERLMYWERQMLLAKASEP